MLGISPRPSARVTAAMGQTLALLALSPAELMQRLAVEAAEAPALRLVPPQGAGAVFLPPVLDPGGLTAPGDSLIAHVLRQIQGMGLAPRERAIALALAEGLEPTGWLGVAPARLARTCGVPEAAVLAVLARLQRMEPGGLFARTLAECLRLQAEAAGEGHAVVLAVLENLPVLAGSGAAVLAQRLGLPVEAVAAAVRQIRGYDPKPGLAFAGPLPPLPPADLVLRAEGATWRALPNPNAFALEVDGARPGRAGAEALRRAVEGRLRIALAIGGRLAHRQRDWLNGGEMAAVTARDLAGETGFHVATVNRALAAVTAQTPFGTRPLRALVSHAVNGTGTSAGALRLHLRDLIAAAGAAPVSDAALVAQLGARGIHVARRTVAKYRRALAQAG